MSIQYSQLSIADIFTDCQDMFLSDKPLFFSILERHIDFSEFIPVSFYSAFYQSLGRKRVYSLDAFIASLIFQKICSIPTDSLLIILLNLCKELREFCGFSKVPDASKFTRFKQDFAPYLEDMFHYLVDYTEPICQAIDSSLASTIAFDTSGIEAYVTENNPKFINSLILRLKTQYKNNKDVNPYIMAYGLMPSSAGADPSIKHMHINGHFCYVHKFGIITNALGIIRHISFLDEDFKQKHSELIIEKKSNSPDEDKSIGDSSALQPVLKDYMALHPSFNYHTFLGDSAFDKFDHYTFLKTTCSFKRVIIPINTRNSSFLPEVGFNEYGYPLCPNDPTLVMKRCGITGGNGRSPRIKWCCPKIKMIKGVYTYSCDNLCSNAAKGRTTYTYNNQDFRMFPGIERGTSEWDNLYKKRGVVEQTINHLKTNMCIADRKSRNLVSTKADVFLACIASLFTVILADRIKKPEYIRSMKPLIA